MMETIKEYKKINKLSGRVVDQIAAGEVIERPSQLLKELIENSLDANSDAIEVTVSSDLDLLTVKDNGTGIQESDLPLVFERHSTSKIFEAQDLFELNSFGFRGEALSAIGAVSKAQLETKHKNDKEGWIYVYENGVKKFMEPSSSNTEGTKITITHLFDSTPARKKFLKSKRHELTLIKRTVQSFSLLHFKKSFKFLVDGKLVFYFQKTDSLFKRYGQVFKNKKVFKVNLPACDIIKEGSAIYLEEPSIDSKTGLSLWTYVQERWIQDKTVAAAIREGLNTYLMHGCFPKGVVDLKIKKDFIDVNVHPMKSEIRYEDSSYIYKTIRKAVSDWAHLAPWKNEVIPSSKSDFSWSIPPEKKRPSFETVKLAIDHQQGDQLSDQRVMYKKTYGDLKSDSIKKLLKKDDKFEPYWSSLMVIGQVNLTYIVAQSDEALFYIDQHAAHERVAFERIKKQWADSEKKDIQNLLMPLTMDLEPQYIEALMSVKDELEGLGVEIELSGPEVLAINTIPGFLKEESIETSLRKLSEEIVTKGGGTSLDEVFELFFATLACHSVIRAGHAMSEDEMKLLLIEMDRYNSRYCPHGRPVYKKTLFSELDRDFGRTL